MVENIKDLSNEEIMQRYSNACAQLGNTQTLIQELSDRVQSLNRDIEKLREKYALEVNTSIQIRKELELRSANEEKNKNS